jgi:sugar diacid utilization regulator
MHCVRKALASLFCVFLSLPSASAFSADERHVVDSIELSRMMRERFEGDRANRELIQRVLGRDEVRDVAQRFGLDLRRAESAVPTLGSDELTDLAARAQHVEQRLAGGDSIVLTTTTIIVIALLVTVIILATD